MLHGLRRLRQVQDEDGCFAPRRGTGGNWVYDHATATLAMVEAYGATGSPLHRGPGQRGLDFIARARNPGGVWRYGVRPGDDDTSVTGWMTMALESARRIGERDATAGAGPSLTVDPEALAAVGRWLDRVTDPRTGRTGYREPGLGPVRPIHRIEAFPPRRSEALTAVGALTRQFLGASPLDPEVARGMALCARRLPAWERDGSIDMTYWYFGTLAAFRAGGDVWNRWDDALETAVRDTQRLDGDDPCGLKGSWDPQDPWGPEGGRVYATALLAMCLEVHYRYDRVFGIGPR